MADGMWKMLEDGSFVLQEPYRTWLKEAKIAATEAWTDGLVSYLEPRCPYSAEFLTKELIRRSAERNDSPMAIFDEFVLEALSGDL